MVPQRHSFGWLRQHSRLSASSLFSDTFLRQTEQWTGSQQPLMSFQPNKLTKRNRTEENLLSVLYLFCKDGAVGAAVSTAKGFGSQGSSGHAMVRPFRSCSRMMLFLNTLQTFFISMEEWDTHLCHWVKSCPTLMFSPTDRHHGGVFFFHFKAAG